MRTAPFLPYARRSRCSTKLQLDLRMKSSHPPPGVAVAPLGYKCIGCGQGEPVEESRENVACWNHTYTAEHRTRLILTAGRDSYNFRRLRVRTRTDDFPTGSEGPIN